MNRLERLIYSSTATGSTGSLLNMAAILAESQRNNARDGLTGALAAHGEIYIQVIEGAPPTLDRLLKRLGGDNRHRDIVVLGRSPVTGRLFDDWTMAHAKITPELRPTLDALMADPEPCPDRTTQVLLQATAKTRATLIDAA